LWSDALIFPEKLLTGEGFPGFPKVNQFIASFPYISLGISILLFFFQAILLNAIAERHKLVERNQLITAAVYLMLMSSQPQMVQPNLMLFVNLLLILLLLAVLNLYGKNEALSALFDAGLLAGLASLLFFPSLVFIVFIFVSLMVFQQYKWREWVVPVIGFVTPWIFFVAYLFLFEGLQDWFNALISAFKLRIPDLKAVTTELIVVWVLVLLLMFPGFGRIFRFSTGSTVDIRRKSSVVFWMLLFAMASTFFSDYNLIIQAYLEFIPITIFSAVYLSRVKRTFFPEVVLFSIFIAIITIKLLNLY
jgi:hypothetical protein